MTLIKCRTHLQAVWRVLQVVETTPSHGRRLTQTIALHSEDVGYGDVSDYRCPSDGRPITATRGPDADGSGGGGPSVAFTASVDAPRRGPCILALQAGNFETCTMPENVDLLWGPISLPRLPEGVPNTCIVASHRLGCIIRVTICQSSSSISAVFEEERINKLPPALVKLHKQL